jgi:hypothetical protein
VITQLVEQLKDTDLWPSPGVDALFSALVATAVTAGRDHPTIRDAIALAELHQICAAGESRLEDFWSAEILTDPARLDAFPYLSNYRDLARAEHQALTAVAPGPLRHIIFAGCGPLPLTALELAVVDPELHITCLDIDDDAADRARDIVDALAPPSHRIVVRHIDAADHDYRTADAVIIAALVGATPDEKLHLIGKIASTLSPSALLAARSVPDDGRQLLYPRIDPTTTGSTVTVLGEWTPPPGVINSLLLLRACPRLDVSRSRAASSADS